MYIEIKQENIKEKIMECITRSVKPSAKQVPKTTSFFPLLKSFNNLDQYMF